MSICCTGLTFDKAIRNVWHVSVLTSPLPSPSLSSLPCAVWLPLMLFNYACCAALMKFYSFSSKFYPHPLPLCGPVGLINRQCWQGNVSQKLLLFDVTGWPDPQRTLHLFLFACMRQRCELHLIALIEAWSMQHLSTFQHPRCPFPLYRFLSALAAVGNSGQGSQQTVSQKMLENAN